LPSSWNRRVPEAVHVTAPASSANLGPGFDALAVALEFRNEVEVARKGDGPPVVHAVGEGEGEAPAGRDNLFVRAFEAAGGDSRGLDVWMKNRIPFARGLGSSAATIAAGLVAARAMGAADGPGDLLEVATALEGHPDNVAAALNGGLTLAWMSTEGPRAIGFGRPEVTFVVVIPDQRLSTEAARAALPEQVPHADAVHNAARMGLLVAALGSGDGGLLAEALDDRLHEPYRASLVPLLGAVREQLGGLPAYGATLSGAGPSVLVWCEPGSELQVARGLDRLPDCAARVAAVADHGATAR
jgi:homoserine kinase